MWQNNYHKSYTCTIYMIIGNLLIVYLKGCGYMESTALRSRYSRNNAYYRKRRTHTREKVQIKELIAKQMVISIFIFILLFAIKTIDTSVTNYVSDRIKWILQQDIKINDIVNEAAAFIDGVINGSIWQGELHKRNMSVADDAGDSISSDTSGDTSSDLSDVSKATSSDNANLAIDRYTDSENFNSSKDSTGQFDLDLITPVEGKLSSPFGPRIDPITQTSKFHYGIDIDTEKDALIKAAAGGEVLEISEDKIYGKNIKIKHPDGTITVYAHCSKMYQIEGSKVDQGDIIAKVGDTGYSTGTHLHFEIWRNGEALDPALYIDVEP